MYLYVGNPPNIRYGLKRKKKVTPMYTLRYLHNQSNVNSNYHSFSGPNVCLARLQMELCRAANIKSKVSILGFRGNFWFVIRSIAYEE